MIDYVKNNVVIINERKSRNEIYNNIFLTYFKNR